MNAQIFKELTQVLFTSSYSSVRLSAQDLAQILHFTTRHHRDSAVFSKTALNWANENNDRFMALELLKLERGIHASEVEGLECLRAHLSRDALLPWIIESYGKFYDQPAASRRCEAFVTVFTVLVILSYLPFVVDLYSDVNLVFSYYAFAFENETLNFSELLTCGDSQLNSSCYDQTGSDHPPSVLPTFANASYDDDLAGHDADHVSGSENIRHMFEVAYWATTASILVSSSFYFFCIAFDESPSFIGRVPDQIGQWGRKRGWSEACLAWLSRLVQVLLTGRVGYELSLNIISAKFRGQLYSAKLSLFSKFSIYRAKLFIKKFSSILFFAKVHIFRESSYISQNFNFL
jgi:hypothetical protein